MAFSVANATSHATAHLKAPSNYASGEELRFANTVQSLISGYYRWHWSTVLANNIAFAITEQELTINAADQNLVLAIVQAHLLEGSTPQPELMIQSDNLLPVTTTQGQPWAVCLISPTTLRLYPASDASYNLRWRYYARPVIFTVNTNNWQIPEAFTDVAKAGMLWQFARYADDDRAPAFEKSFFDLLVNHKRAEQLTMGRNRG